MSGKKSELQCCIALSIIDKMKGDGLLSTEEVTRLKHLTRQKYTVKSVWEQS